MYESFLYHPEKGIKTRLSPTEIAAALKDERSVLWVDVCDIDDADIDLLTSAFSLHSMTVEDFIMPNVVSKIEKFENYLFAVLFTPGTPGGETGEADHATELNCCLGRNYLITLADRPIGQISTCKAKLELDPAIIMNGADMLFYHLLDSAIDGYFPIIHRCDDMADEISDVLFRDPDQKVLKKIYDLKNRVMYLRRTIGPQADIISTIARGDYEFIRPANAVYFRNIYDNLVRLDYIIGTTRDILTGAMEVYTSTVSNRLNEVMKTLTVIATIMMPLTLIASIYGMNFKHMPALDSDFGYLIVISIMVTITAGMLLYFRSKKWV